MGTYMANVIKYPDGKTKKRNILSRIIKDDNIIVNLYSILFLVWFRGRF